MTSPALPQVQRDISDPKSCQRDVSPHNSVRRMPSPPITRVLGIPEYRSPKRFHPGGARNYDYEEKYSEDAPGQEASDDARVWKVYLDEAEVYDDDMVRGFRDTIDSLLVFAALFSAVITTLAVESSSVLLPDHMEIATHLLAEQVSLLRANGNASAISAIPSSNYAPSAATHATVDVWINALFFTSLSLAISVALVSVLAKQWLQAYTSLTLGTAKERALVRHFRFAGLEKWKLGDIVAALPLLLHLSLAIFAVGLILFVHSRHPPISWVLVFISMTVFLLYAVGLTLPAFYLECPYRIPLLESPAQGIAWLGRLIRYYGYESSITLSTHIREIWHRRGQWFGKREDSSYRNPTRRRTQRPRLNFHAPQEAELLRACHDIPTRCNALGWMCSVSSNPSVARVCGQALSGLLPGPGDTHQRGVNQAWLRLQEKQRQTVTSSLIRLYPLVWRQVEDEAHSFHRFDELFENLVDCFSPSYNPWIRAEALLRSWIIRFGDPHDRGLVVSLRSKAFAKAVTASSKDLSEFILQSSRVVKPSNSFELPWSLSDLPDLDVSYASRSDSLHHVDSVLHVFAQQGNTGTLERVLPFTSNVNLTSELHAGRRPLHVAAAEGHLDFVKVLCTRGDIDFGIRDNYGDTAFRVALRLGQLEVARFLLPFTPDSDLQRPFRRPEEGVVKSVSLLHHTSWIGEVNLSMALINRGTDVNLQDDDNRTPLFMASKQGHTEIVTLLLDSSADPHLFGNWHTPLTVACQYGHGDVASLLLDMPGMDPNMQPVLSEAHAHARRGETALHSASRGGSAEVVLVLLEWGADPHILDARGRSPRDIALMYDYEKIFNLLDLYDLPW